MTTVKNEVFIGLLHENCYLVGGGEKLVGWETTWAEFFQVGGG